MTDLLKKLKDLHYLDWGVVLHAWNGIPGFNWRIKASDIVELAVDELKYVEDTSMPILVELTSAEDLSEYEVKDLLEKLCEKRGINLETALHKWRVVALEELLDNLSNDPIYDLIKITNFWSSWEFPSDSPHIVQGVENDITPTEYYTEENLNRILRAHRDWISREIRRLNSTE